MPLAAVLSKLLENIEADLADGKLDAVQTERLRWRAELIGWLLTHEIARLMTLSKITSSE